MHLRIHEKLFLLSMMKLDVYYIKIWNTEMEDVNINSAGKQLCCPSVSVVKNIAELITFSYLSIYLSIWVRQMKLT